MPICFIMASIFPSWRARRSATLWIILIVCSCLWMFPVSPRAFIRIFISSAMSVTSFLLQPQPGESMPSEEETLTQPQTCSDKVTSPSPPYGIRLSASSGSRSNVCLPQQHVARQQPVVFHSMCRKAAEMSGPPSTSDDIAGSGICICLKIKSILASLCVVLWARLNMRWMASSARWMLPVSPRPFMRDFNSSTIPSTNACSHPQPGEIGACSPSDPSGDRLDLKLWRQPHSLIFSTLPSSPYGIRLTVSWHKVLEVKIASSGSSTRILEPYPKLHTRRQQFVTSNSFIARSDDSSSDSAMLPKRRLGA
mmetsp:Transcript_45144/g.144599  ORF Transcript_45144/g.144599 Transcript_45144/m.144599 type:complete len:309 (+) Transcript_45144:243-1169(+)